MDTNRNTPPERLRLPGADEADAPGSSGRVRNDGLRRVRRMSNWTAAALVVGTGATVVALASHSFPATTSSNASGTTMSGTNSQGASVQGANAPHVGGSVVTSGGSGSTVTTTTHVVNGKTVVTKVTHPAVYHDN